MAADEKQDRLRALGLLERFHYTRTKLGYYNNVASTAQYLLSTDIVGEYGGLEAITFACLKSVILKHPIMGVSIVDASPNSASSIKLKTIDLQVVVQFVNISGGHAFIEDAHQKAFERMGELPLWRVIVAEQSKEDTEGKDDSNAKFVFDLAFVFHHTLGDGTSGAAFHRDFLCALNTLGAHEMVATAPSYSIIEIPELKLLPSMESARNWPLSIWFVVKIAFTALILGNNDSKLWTGPPVLFSEDSNPKTCLLTHILTPEESTKVVQLCRQNKTTMTPLLTLLIARCLSVAYPSQSRFIASIAVSLRRFTGIDSTQMVDQASGINVHCSSRGEPGFIPCGLIDWNTVRACKKIIDDSIKSPKNQITTLLKFLNDFGGFFKSKIGQKKDQSFEISNVGVIDGESSGNKVASFHQFVFSQSANVIESACVFSVASVRGGSMAVTLTWQEGVIEEDKAKKIMDDLGTELHLLTLETDLRSAHFE